MTIAHSLDHIVVVPRNGYVNRLQAWASAAILGAELDVPVQVLWEPEMVAPASASLLFSEQVVNRSFVDSDVVSEFAGAPHADLPRYLTVDRDRRLVILAGHDQGEQAFMERLGWALADDCRPRTLLIIAGGKFHLPDAADFTRQREVFYQRLEWHPAIIDRTNSELAAHGAGAYLGLHIRQTDRTREAPSARAIRLVLGTLAEESEVRSLFIAADTEAGRRHWAAIARELGLAPWSASNVALDRQTNSAGQDAMVDWLLLGRALTLVYSASSSFGEEAAVAAGRTGYAIALSAGPALQRIRDLAELAHAARTYPARHWNVRRRKANEG